MRRVLLALLLVAAPCLRGQFVVPEGSDFHNGSELLLEDDGTAADLLRRLDEALVVGDVVEVAFAYESLRRRAGDALVPDGERTHVPALELAAARVVAAGDGAACARIEATARARLARASAERDLPALLDEATRGVALSVAREASLLAARFLFEEGRWWEAATLAARAGELPGAATLLEAAEQRLAPEPARPPAGGEWVQRFAFLRPRDVEREAATPVALSGRGPEVFVLDHQGLFGLDPTPTPPVLTSAELSFQERALGEERFFATALPAPRRHALALAGARLLVPFNVVRDQRSRAPWVRREARLLAIDPATLDAPAPLPGEVAWQWRAEGSTSSTALGPVLVRGGRAFALLFRISTSADVALVAFDVGDGRLLFETPLVRGAPVVRYASRRAELSQRDVDKREREGAPAEHGGLVYACTGYGVVAAVDGLTGRVRHAFRYDRLSPTEPDEYDPAYLFESGGWNHEPVRVWLPPGGEAPRIVVAPSDSRYLYMLAALPGPEGQLILDDPIERLDRRDVVALLPDPQGRPSPSVLLSRLRDNRPSLVQLGPDGHVLRAWPALDEHTPVASWPYPPGRPLLVGHQVLLPTERGVRVFDLDDATVEPGVLPPPEGAEAFPVAAIEAAGAGVVGITPVVDSDKLVVQYWSPR